MSLHTKTEADIKFERECLYSTMAEFKQGSKNWDDAKKTADVCMDALISIGRVSVLREFKAMCLADAFLGFSDAEWNAVKKFFAMNESISDWDGI